MIGTRLLARGLLFVLTATSFRGWHVEFPESATDNRDSIGWGMVGKNAIQKCNPL